MTTTEIGLSNRVVMLFRTGLNVATMSKNVIHSLWLLSGSCNTPVAFSHVIETITALKQFVGCYEGWERWVGGRKAKKCS